MQVLAAKMASHIFAISFLWAVTSNAHAVLIVGSGVDTVTKHYQIDAARSAITYDYGVLFVGSEQPAITETFALSGAFDMEIQHWWWSYHLDGDFMGTQGTFVTSSDWVRFVNPAISPENGLPPSYQFPTFYSSLTSPTEFAGSGDACNYPRAPDFYCSGFNLGGISSLSGRIAGGKIVIDGTESNGFTLGGGNSYHIEASVVPVPAAAWLFVSGLGFWGVRAKSIGKTEPQDESRAN